MRQNFTNEDLEQMLAECVSELESLGYEVLPISSIEFTNKASRKRFGSCNTDKKKCYYDPLSLSWKGVPTVYIRITGNLRYLPCEKRMNLKTLVMHETIHAIKAPENSIAADAIIYDFATPHGDRYDTIKERVERELGYYSIDDDTCCGLSSFLDTLNSRPAK